MNAFYEHHKDSIRFNYRCFDRILLNGLIQPFQQPERVVGFFDAYRHLYPVSRDILRGAAEQFQVWVKERAVEWNAPIVEAPKGRRDEFVDPYFKGTKADQIVVILKAREPARIMTAIGDKKVNRWHLQIADRWIVQYNFYVNDRQWGRMFVRMCPYLPFSARVCLNQHHWLANRMREEGVGFEQCSNAFRKCAAPERLQELADSLTAADLSTCGLKWLAHFTPFFSEAERKQAGCQHRLFFSQIEYCDNLIFYRRAALDKLGDRLLDANRTIGQPNKITVIFGRKVTKQYRGKLQTEIEDMGLPNPVIRSHYRNGFIKQYVRDHLILRTEPATNNVTDYGMNKAIEHLPALRDKMAAVIDNYLDIQQDILETFVDRGQLRQLAKPTLTPTGKRIPGLKLDNPRQLALMHALARFAQIPPASTFSTAEIYPHAVAALDSTTEQYSLASLRYDLSKLRVKGLVEKLPRSRRYHLRAQGYSVCLIFLKLFERVYAPLTAASLHPVPGDAAFPPQKRSLLDRLCPHNGLEHRVARAAQGDGGLTTMGAARERWYGIGWAKGTEHRSIRAIFPMYDSPFQFAPPKRLKLASLEGFAGKRIGDGPDAGTAGTYVPGISRGDAVLSRNRDWRPPGSRPAIADRSNARFSPLQRSRAIILVVRRTRSPRSFPYP